MRIIYMKRQLFPVLLVLGMLSVGAFGQVSEVPKIDAMVRSIDKISKGKGAELVFADTRREDSSKAVWKKFPSEKALDKHRETAETYSIAYCWRKDGRLAAANFTLFSPSGDWAKYVYSYYRPTGTLAKAAVDYRTFNGDFILEQDIYFNESGKEIKRTERFLDLQTHKPKKLSKSYRENAQQMAKEVDYYKTTSKLPFAKLLK